MAAAKTKLVTFGCQLPTDGRDERSTDRAAMVCEKRVNSTKALGGRGHGNFLPSRNISRTPFESEKRSRFQHK